MQWRDRLVGALREMKAGELAEEALAEVFQINGNVEIKNDSPPTLVHNILSFSLQFVTISICNPNMQIHLRLSTFSAS